jgi:hypothetical protein
VWHDLEAKAKAIAMARLTGYGLSEPIKPSDFKFWIFVGAAVDVTIAAIAVIRFRRLKSA